MENNLQMEIGHSIMDFSRSFKAFMRIELSHHNMNLVEGLTLLALFEESGRSAESLLDTVSVDKSVMTRTLQSLERSGLVSRKPNPSDGRSRLFEITDIGRGQAKAVIDAIRKWGESAFMDLDEEETMQLLELLRKLK